jgi:hypothetical protein
MTDHTVLDVHICGAVRVASTRSKSRSQSFVHLARRQRLRGPSRTRRV